MMLKTRPMRVPVSFWETSLKLSRKRGYKSNVKFLDEEGTRLLQNADRLSDLFFGRKRKK